MRRARRGPHANRLRRAQRRDEPGRPAPGAQESRHQHGRRAVLHAFRRDSHAHPGHLVARRLPERPPGGARASAVDGPGRGAHQRRVGRPLDGMLVVASSRLWPHRSPPGSSPISAHGSSRSNVRAGATSPATTTAPPAKACPAVRLAQPRQGIRRAGPQGGGRAAGTGLAYRPGGVFVCNLAPAAIRRLGLEAAQLTARHPRLVACQLSGYGETGPYADRKAYDLLVQAEAGILAVTGSPEAPAKAGISIADIAGGMYAYSGILSALPQRTRTGRGGVAWYPCSLLSPSGCRTRCS